VDVLLDVVIAGEPGEVIPVANLVLHLGFIGLALEAFARVAEPVSAHRDDVADGSVLQTLDHLAVTRLVPALKADADFQILFLCFLGVASTRRMPGASVATGFLHEDVLALAHRFLEVKRAEAGRGGENHHIGARDGLLVAIEAEKLPLARNVHVIGVRLLQRAETGLQFLLLHIGHGDELEIGVGIERLVGRARAAPAATDERHSQCVTRAASERGSLDRKLMNQGDAGSSRRGAVEKVATRQGQRWGCVHGT
jgi:hypothetical protein